MAWSSAPVLEPLEPRLGWSDDVEYPTRTPEVGWTGTKQVAVPAMAASAALDAPSATSGVRVYVPAEGLLGLPFQLPGLLLERPQMNGHAVLHPPERSFRVEPPVMAADAALSVPEVVSGQDRTVAVPVMAAAAELNLSLPEGGVDVLVPPMLAITQSGDEGLPVQLPFPLLPEGVMGMWPPTVSATMSPHPGPLLADAVLHVPDLEVGHTVAVPTMAADAELPTPVPAASQELTVGNVMAADAEQAPATVAAGTRVAAPTMTAAAADFYELTVASGANIAAGIILESTGHILTPAVASSAVVPVPTMTATAEMGVPEPEASDAPPIEAVPLLADAEMNAPVLLVGHTVAVPVLAATAALPAATPQMGVTVTVGNVMDADAESTGLPYQLPFPLGGGPGLHPPDIYMWTDTARPDPLPATATLLVPTVQRSATVAVPTLMTAAAALRVPTPQAGTRVGVPMLMTATGNNLRDVNKAPLPMSPVPQNFSSAGGYTYNIPSDAIYIDIMVLGGGASGQTGSGLIGGRGDGGNAGGWANVVLQRGVHIPWSLTQITGTVGAGGAQAPNSDYGGPNSGSASTAVISGYGTITGSGGSGTTSGQNGASPGNQTLNGVTYTGGSGGTGNGGAASAPGAAGAGGNGGFFGSRTRGGAGATGRVWFRAYQ